jgi:hypothetical protein
MCLVYRLLSGRPGHLQFHAARGVIRVSCRDFDSSPAPFVRHQVADATAAGHGKQTPLAVIPLVTQEMQQRHRIDARLPVSFRHQAGADSSGIYQQGVDYPATWDVWSWTSTVCEDSGIGTTRSLQHVTQQGERLETSLVVNLPGSFHRHPALPA